MKLIWIRYLDDIFAHKWSQYDTIKFTCELENEGKIHFLDLLLTTEPDGCIDIGISLPLSRLHRDSMSLTEYKKEHIQDVACANGYDNNFVDKLI